MMHPGHHRNRIDEADQQAADTARQREELLDSHHRIVLEAVNQRAEHQQRNRHGAEDHQKRGEDQIHRVRHNPAENLLQLRTDNAGDQRGQYRSLIADQRNKTEEINRLRIAVCHRIGVGQGGETSISPIRKPIIGVPPNFLNADQQINAARKAKAVSHSTVIRVVTEAGRARVRRQTTPGPYR